MLLLKKLNQEGFDFNKLPDDLQQATDAVLNSNDEPQKIQMLDLVTYKCIRKLYKKEVENTITDIAFKQMPGNDGFNTRVADNSFAAGGATESNFKYKKGDVVYVFQHHQAPETWTNWATKAERKKDIEEYNSVSSKYIVGQGTSRQKWCKVEILENGWGDPGWESYKVKQLDGYRKEKVFTASQDQMSLTNVAPVAIGYMAKGGETDQQPLLVSVIEEKLPKVLHEDTLKIEYAYKTDGGYAFNMISRTDYPVNRATPKLQRIGIKVERTGEKGKRLITIPESIFNAWTKKSFAAGGTTETRYQIKNKDGEYYSRLGGAEHFNSVPEFGLFYNDEEAEDVKEYLEKKGYKNLQIVPYVPQHEHAYAAGGPIQTSNIVLFGSSPVEIVGIGRSKAEVKDSKGNRYNVSISSLKEAPQYVINKFIETTYKPEYWHSKQQYDAGKNFAAGGPIETPQQLGSALKAYFKKKYNLDILTRYIKTVRGLDGSWYEISSFRSGQIIPNEVRLEILRRFRPDAVPASGLEDIHYGNISSQRISLYGREWKEFLQAQEGKMAKGGPTMGDIIKANKDRIILARPAAAISDKQMDMKEFTDLIKKIKWFTPGHQLDYLGNLFRSEEKDGAIEIAKRLAGIIDKMPKVYETEDTETNDKILYLHYFYAGSDWYIIEKDTSTEQHQAFGYAILNGDTEMAEWGYISLEEFRSSKKIELDFYFDPVKFGELKKKWEEREEKSEPKVYQKPRPGTFLYGQDFDVPESYSDVLLDQLSRKGFSIVKKNGPSVDLSKDGHTFYVNDNGGELNLGDVKTREHISNIPYSITTGIRKPSELATDIEADFKEYYKPAPKYKIGDKIMLKPQYLKKEPIMRHFNEATITEVSSYYTPETGYMYDTIISQDKSPRHFYESEIEPINKPASSIQHPASTYANAYELNKAIEKLLDSKPNDADFTADEKAFLKYYSGYGGLEKFGATGKGLLYEYYTPALIAEKMWGLAYKYGFSGGPVLEPSAGIGEFIKYAPEQNLVVAHEINPYSARICKILYPLITISTQYFEQIFIKNNDSIKGKIGLLPKYKLVIGNPPYGEFGGKWAGMGEKNYTRAGNYIDYFIFRGLDLLDPGGLLVFIVGAEVASGGKCFLSQQMNKCKDEIMEKSDLLDAYRLPNGVFERTDVLSDIIVLRKK